MVLGGKGSGLLPEGFELESNCCCWGGGGRGGLDILVVVDARGGDEAEAEAEFGGDICLGLPQPPPSEPWEAGDFGEQAPPSLDTSWPSIKALESKKKRVAPFLHSTRVRCSSPIGIYGSWSEKALGIGGGVDFFAEWLAIALGTVLSYGREQETSQTLLITQA